MRSFGAKTSFIVAAFVAAAMSAASAQSSGGGYGYGMMGPGMMGSGGWGYGNMGPWMMGSGTAPMMGWGGQDNNMCTIMAGHVEGRLAYLKTELKITKAQEPLWNAYADAARTNAQTMLAHCSTMMSKVGQDKAQTLSLPERLDQREQFMAAHLDAMRAMDKALKPLYAAFSEAQKQDANQLFWTPMGMML